MYIKTLVTIKVASWFWKSPTKYAIAKGKVTLTNESTQEVDRTTELENREFVWEQSRHKIVFHDEGGSKSKGEVEKVPKIIGIVSENPNKPTKRIEE